MTTIFDSFLDQALRSLPLAPLKPAAKATALPPRAALAGRYARFISIDIRHEFYNRSAGQCSDIVIAPTPRTAERLALYGYVVRRRIGGIDLFWDLAVRAQANGIFAGLQARYGQVPEDVWARLFEPPLLFTLRLANPRFAIFTEMPTDFRIGDPPLRLSTRANIPDGDGRAALTLDWTTRLTRPSIVDTHGMEGVGTSTPLIGGADPAPLSPAEQGPAAQERVQVERHAQALALLDLHFTRADPARVAGWDGMPVERAPARPRGGTPDFFRPVTYTLTFAARRTRWRYFVAARDGTLDASSLGVVAADGGDAGFRLDPAPRRLPDGRAAACLAGEVPRAILASPTERLALTGRPLGGRSYARTLVDTLPGAGADSITPARPAPAGGAPPPAWSDIYVFV
ncbi:hypothetical protein FHS95_002595 [Sphingomonas naasensis]|uniref:glycosyltransferase family 4 protein n=1 Tax=Sphingomonas naasensis TaxID=1344951 RepID=UPI00141B1E9D|nr:glycosyltransferase family 4 protein [Sphingomonas naasensis]NIJ20903.1 hypothetical protein [Sphingomonas naasensis]